MPEPRPLPASLKDPNTEKTRFTVSELKDRFAQNEFDELFSELESEKFSALYELAQNTGANIYLTGGIIRDTLSGAQPKDFDFVINIPDASDPIAARESFESHFGKKIITNDSKGNEVIDVVGEYGTLQLRGKNVGVYKFYPKGFEGEEAIDIAFPRTEQAIAGSVGGARDFNIQADATLPIEDDLSRRDFTINALTLDIAQWLEGNDPEIIDMFGGLTDLENGVLDSIGDPYERLNESIDRVLRAVRFKNQKDYVMSERLNQAVYDLSTGTNGKVPAFERRNHDGSLTIPKEKITPEFLKGFYTNPAGMIEDLRRYGMLDSIFPDLVGFRPYRPGAIPKRYAKNEAVRTAAISTDFVHENAEIRAQSLEEIIQALQIHMDTFGKEADIDELCFILFHELGKCRQFAIDRTDKPRVYDKEHYTFGKMQMERLMTESLLYSMDSAHKLRVHPEVIADMFDRYPQAIGLLSVDHGEKLGDALADDPRLVAQIHRVFPGLSRDPLLRVLQSDMLTSKHTDAAIGQIPRLLQQVGEVEKIIEAAPMMRKELFDGGALVRYFYLPPGPMVGEIERKVTENAYYKAIASGGYQTDDEVKRELFAYIVNLPEVRKSWEDYLLSENTLQLFSTDDEAGNELLRRDLLHAIENACAASYLGEDLVEAAELSASVRLVMTRQEGRTGFPQRFITTLSQKPNEVLDWLEDGFKNDGAKREGRRLSAILFPEIKELRGCTQDDTYHSEGDVWTHTRLLFEKAEELGYELTPDMAMSLLYHDIGKPVTRSEEGDRIRFIGHEAAGLQLFAEIDQRMRLHNAHDLDVDEVKRIIRDHSELYKLWQNRNISALDVRRLLPDGEGDLLLKVIKCDTAASISGSGERDDYEIFDVIDGHLERMKLEGEDRGIFDVIAGSEKIREVLGERQESAKMGKLYEVYLDLIEDGKLATTDDPADAMIVVMQRFLQVNRGWTANYVKRVLAPGRMFVEKGITGKRIGEIQNHIVEILMNGEGVDLTNLADM